MKSNFNSRFSLQGHVVLVSGAAGILGSELCRGVLGWGGTLAAFDRSSTALHELAQRLRAEFPECKMHFCTGDVGSVDGCEEALSEFEKNLGPISVLLNNAATKGEDLSSFLKDSLEYTADTWNEVMRVNLTGAFFLDQAFARRWIRRNSNLHADFASIVHTTSIYGVMGPDLRIYEGSFYHGQPINTPAVYSATKAGLVGLTRYFASVWAKDQIRVNAVAPGGIESGQNSEFQKKYSERVPLNRMARVEEVVDAILFLASPASSYITGQTLMVDGGLSAW